MPLAPDPSETERRSGSPAFYLDIVRFVRQHMLDKIRTRQYKSKSRPKLRGWFYKRLYFFRHGNKNNQKSERNVQGNVCLATQTDKEESQ